MPRRPPERRCRQLPAPRGQPQFPPRRLEQRLDLLGVLPFALHAAAEARVVEAATADIPDAVENSLPALRELLLEPGLEQGSDGAGQAERNERRALGTCRGCGG